MKIPVTGPAKLAAAALPRAATPTAMFVVPAEAAGRAGAASAVAAAAIEATAAAPAASGPGRSPPARDRQARRYARDVLAELAVLQHATLAHDGGRAAAGALSRLAGLAASTQVADDPALAAIVDDVVLRAKVELARCMQP